MASLPLSLSLLLLLLIATLALSEPTNDKQALLSFISTTPHSTRLSWDPNRSACDWVGVTCDPTRSFVFSLRLPGMGLLGPIRPNTLTNLTRLRVLSLRSNSLSGSLPGDLSSLSLLRSLYLQHNNLSGELPASLSELTRLSRLDLSTNRFSGSIPFSLNNLSRLTRLFLQNNSFSGNLPSLGRPGLVDFDVSNNRLNGSVPAALGRFPAAAFAGNLDLCGGPLRQCPFFPAPAPAPEGETAAAGKRRRSGLSGGAIAGIVVGAVMFVLLLVVVLVLCCTKKKKGHVAKTPKNTPPATTSRAIADAGTSSSIDVSAEGGGGERNKLVFFENGGYSFDLEDLLRASAEVLGKGSVGTSYKAVLEEGTTVVVKRLKDVAVGKREFEVQMEVLGKIKSEFVVPFRAYYFSKDEKLLVCDYMPAGSLSALLHGSRGSGRTPLDWENRIRIALSTARGLAHLHVSSNVVHGNLKASNILLRSDHDASLSDFGLNQIFGSSSPPNRVAGYRAPEIIETRHVTFKSDVYSFGVLVLELLTGKSPNQASLGEEGIDLPRWVQSVVREEWTAEVFDVELMRYHNIEEEMVQLLQIGMACVSIVPDQRPSMSEVVRMIEDINRGETDDGLRQSSDDPSKGSDGQTPPQRRSPPPLTP